MAPTPRQKQLLLLAEARKRKAEAEGVPPEGEVIEPSTRVKPQGTIIDDEEPYIGGFFSPTPQSREMAASAPPQNTSPNAPGYVDPLAPKGGAPAQPPAPAPQPEPTNRFAAPPGTFRSPQQAEAIMRARGEVKRAEQEYERFRASRPDWMNDTSDVIIGGLRAGDEALRDVGGLFGQGLDMLRYKIDPEDKLGQAMTPGAEMAGESLAGIIAGQRPGAEVVTEAGRAAGGGMAEWLKTMGRNPAQGVGEAVDMLEPTHMIAEGSNNLSDAVGDVMRGDMEGAWKNYEEATPDLLFGTLGVTPFGSMAVTAGRNMVKAPAAAAERQIARAAGRDAAPAPRSPLVDVDEPTIIDAEFTEGAPPPQRGLPAPTPEAAPREPRPVTPDSPSARTGPRGVKDTREILGNLIRSTKVPRADVDKLVDTAIASYERFKAAGGANVGRYSLGRYIDKNIASIVEESGVRISDTAQRDIRQAVRGRGRAAHGDGGPGDQSRAIMSEAIGDIRTTQKDWAREQIEARDAFNKAELAGEKKAIKKTAEEIGREAYGPTLDFAKKVWAKEEAAAPGELEAMTKLRDYLLRKPYMENIPDSLKMRLALDEIPLEQRINEDPVGTAHWLQSKFGESSAAKSASGDKDMAGALGDARARLLEELDAAVPAYKNARADFGDEFRTLRAGDFGREWFSDVIRPEDVAERADTYAKMTTREKKLARLSTRDEIMTIFEAGPEEAALKLAKLAQEGNLKALEKVFGAPGKKVADTIREIRDEALWLNGDKDLGLQGVDSLAGSNSIPNAKNLANDAAAIRNGLQQNVTGFGDRTKVWGAALADVALMLGSHGAYNTPMLTMGVGGAKASKAVLNPSKRKLANSTEGIFSNPKSIIDDTAETVIDDVPPPPKPKATPKPKAPLPETMRELQEAFSTAKTKTARKAIRKKMKALNDAEKAAARDTIIDDTPPDAAGFFASPARPKMNPSDARVIQAARELSPQQFEAWKYASIDGMRLNEIADAMGLSPSAAATHLKRAEEAGYFIPSAPPRGRSQLTDRIIELRAQGLDPPTIAERLYPDDDPAKAANRVRQIIKTYRDEIEAAKAKTPAGAAEGASAVAGGAYGYANPQDTDGDGDLDAEDRHKTAASYGIGSAVSMGIGRKLLRGPSTNSIVARIRRDLGDGKSAETIGKRVGLTPEQVQRVAQLADEADAAANATDEVAFTTKDGTEYAVHIEQGKDGAEVAFHANSGPRAAKSAMKDEYAPTGKASLAEAREVFSNVERVIKEDIAAKGRPRYVLKGRTKRQRGLYAQMAKRRAAPDGYTWEIGDDKVALVRQQKPEQAGFGAADTEGATEAFQTVSSPDDIRALQREAKDNIGRPTDVRLTYDPATGQLYAYNGFDMTHSQAAQMLGVSDDLRATLKPGERLNKAKWYNAGDEGVDAPELFKPKDEGVVVYRGSAEDEPGVIENGRLGLGKYSAEDPEIGAEWGGKTGKVDAYRVKGKLFDLDETTAQGLENYEKQANTPAAEKLFARLKAEGYVGVRDPWSGHINVFDDKDMIRYADGDKEIGSTWTNDDDLIIDQAGFGGAPEPLARSRTRPAAEMSDEMVLKAAKELTAQEFEVLKLARAGGTNASIGQKLGGLSNDDVASLISRIREKGFDVQKLKRGPEMSPETKRIVDMKIAGSSNSEIAKAVFPKLDPKAAQAKVEAAVNNQRKAIAEARSGRTLIDDADESIIDQPNPRFQINQNTFGGANAKTANKVALARAQRMEKEGATRDDIWNETGWFKGADGKWKFEIDDSRSRITKEASEVAEHRPYVGNAYNVHLNDDVYRAYPKMLDEPAVYSRSASESGSYTPENGVVRASGPDDDAGRSVMLHEQQHSIQEREGFATGGSPENVSIDSVTDINKQLSQLARDIHILRERQATSPKSASLDQQIADLKKQYDDLMSVREDSVTPEKRMEAYKNLAGETEARNVQTRRNFSPEQRRATPPWETQDVADEEQIVRFGSGKQASLIDDAPDSIIDDVAEAPPAVGMPKRIAERLNVGKLSPELRQRLSENAAKPAGERVSPMEAAGDLASELYEMAGPFMRKGSELNDRIGNAIAKLAEQSSASPGALAERRIEASRLLAVADHAAIEATATARKANSAHTRASNKYVMKDDREAIVRPQEQRMIQTEQAAADAAAARDQAKAALSKIDLELLSFDEAKAAAQKQLQEITDALAERAEGVAGLPAYNPMRPQSGARPPKVKEGSRAEAEEMARLIFDTEAADILAKVQSGELVPKPHSWEHNLLSFLANHPLKSGAAAATATASGAGWGSVIADVKGGNTIIDEPEPEVWDAPEDPRIIIDWPEFIKNKTNVRAMQVYLQRVEPKLYLRPDSHWGPGTEKALKFWQNKNGFKPDGVMDDEQWELLYMQAEGGAEGADMEPAEAALP